MPFPNNDTQFEPGQSGNPKGRPKGARSLSTILQEMLEEPIEIVVDGKKQKREFREVIIRKLLKKANDGDMRLPYANAGMFPIRYLSKLSG